MLRIQLTQSYIKFFPTSRGKNIVSTSSTPCHERESNSQLCGKSHWLHSTTLRLRLCILRPQSTVYSQSKK